MAPQMAPTTINSKNPRTVITASFYGCPVLPESECSARASPSTAWRRALGAPTPHVAGLHPVPTRHGVAAPRRAGEGYGRDPGEIEVVWAMLAPRQENGSMQTQPHHDTARHEASVEKLQECLRAELSAVETYELALRSVTHVGLHHTLQEILASHGRRTDLPRAKVARLGAEPATSSGSWGAFAKTMQAGADLLGARVAIAALEEGEDRALALYTSGLDRCNARTRRYIETELLPEQRRTHDLCRTLQSYLNAPS